jgi:CheY-like chemotaxis protein
MMGGEIWVESKEDVGSAFHFTASFGLPEQALKMPRHNLATDLLDVPVLIVDDNPTSRRVLQAILMNWQLRPSTAVHGPSAISALHGAIKSGRPFSLVILDISMPEMDGFAVATQMRQDPDLIRTPIIMLTSADDQGVAGQYPDLKVSAFLRKPVRQADLFDAILHTVHRETAIQEEPPPAVDIWHPCGGGAAGSTADPASLRILVAEDNEINRRLVARILEKQGHDVSYAENGEDVLAALDRESFDLILMDVQMPGMDGLDATVSIRERERSKGTHIPVLAMTAHTLKGDRERCLKAGMDGFISKPLRRKEFLEAISTVLSGGDRVTSANGDPAERPVVDAAAVLSRFDGDRTLLQEAAELFQHSIPRLLSQLQDALEKGDLILVERTAHSIKGSVGNFGGIAAMESAMRLEMMGRSGDLSEGVQALEDLEYEVGRLIPAIAQLS